MSDEKTKQDDKNAEITNSEENKKSLDKEVIKKPDKKALEKERKEIISKMLRIQKEFMALEREKGVTEKDIHHNPQGIVKEYKEEHEKLANRLVDIAHELKGSIRT
tara:strand:+ start:300 stop:617 length:318 start_codon:yes stop_codon:yes gene_type:complete